MNDEWNCGLRIAELKLSASGGREPPDIDSGLRIADTRLASGHRPLLGWEIIRLQMIN